MGYDVHIIPPNYVKPFVKRQKNDAADAEALAEAAVRPNMRFVPIKSQEQQARAMALKTRDLLVRQRNQLVNALRGHLMEFGVVVSAGLGSVKHLADQIARPDSNLPAEVVALSQLLLDHLGACTARIGRIEHRLMQTAASDLEIVRLRSVPGVGLISALALKAFAPPMQSFRHGRDFAAWLGLVPSQRSTGGRQRLGPTSKMGQRDIRRLLIIGAMSQIRWAARKNAVTDPWLTRMLERKPRLLVAVALANRTARRIWAVTTTQRDYRSLRETPTA